MLRWGSDRYQRIFDAPDHDFSSVFLRLREVVGGLRPQPRLGPPPKAFSRRIAISADIPALPLTRLFIACRVTPNTFAASVTESPRGSRQSCRTDNPGWGGFFIRIVGALVGVNEIHTVGAAVPETENDPSVVRHKRETRTFYFFESAWSISMCARYASTENCQAVFFSLLSIPFSSVGTGSPFSSAFTGERPDCPSLRASSDHSLIVGALRAQRTVWPLPSLSCF